MVIGIDYGTKRTGIAVSDESETLAFPHDVWETTKNLAEEVAVFARERGASGIIVGESHDLAGNPNPVAKDIEKLVDTLQAHLPIPIQYEPEYFTSRQAARIQGRRKKLRTPPPPRSFFRVLLISASIKNDGRKDNE